jgi:ABC-type bacteriocin/lantibiotic exporter with double-glycine peptidase domain
MKPFIPQKNHDGCAIAVLTMALNYFGVYQNYNQIESNFINKNLSFIDLIEFFKHHNLKANPKIINNQNVNQICCFPIIIHLKNHFILVYEKNNNKFIYADPAGIGLRKGSLSFKLRKWKGHYLDLSANNIKPPIKVEFHLPYILRLIILNIIVIITIYQIIK